MSNESELNYLSTDPIETLKGENPILDLTKDQVKQIEEYFQAAYGYKKGLNGTLCVSASDEFNPVRIMEFPREKNKNDFLLRNRAIAKVGLFLEYWRLYGEALKSGQMNFYNQISYSFTPILNKSGEVIPALLSNTSLFGDLILEDPEKERYEERIGEINYAGDGDFVGIALGAIATDIKVKINGDIKYFPRWRLGITKSLTKQVGAADTEIRRMRAREITDILWDGKESFDDTTQLLIGETFSSSGTLEGYELLRTWLKSWSRDYDNVIFEIVREVSNYVNSVYSENPESFETLSAVKRMVELMEVMYQKASRHYRA
jgi:hypothetical protein